MAIRLNPDQTAALLAALARTQQQESKALLQLSSGRRINAPSDDPSGTAALVQLRARGLQADQFLRNVSGLRAQLQVADATLNSAVLALTRAITLGVQGANDTLSPANRQALASEVAGLKQQLQGLANTGFQGEYLFAGTNVTTQPFVSDPAQPSGVRYDGNATANSVEIATGELLQLNLPGDAIFADPAAGAFQALQDLAAALQLGTDSNAVAQATTAVQNAFHHVNNSRAFYGAALNRLETTETFLNRERFELSRSEDDLAAADLAKTITDLSAAQTARNATLAASAKISQLSLLDFLK